MGSIIKTIINYEELALKRGWEKSYWLIDIHGTVIKPNYSKEILPNEFYTYALECLKLISGRPDICLILWTCSWPDEIRQYLDLFQSFGVHFDYVNKNPEVISESYGCYEEKLYANLICDDKAGFDPYEDWEIIFNYLKQNKANGKQTF